MASKTVTVVSALFVLSLAATLPNTQDQALDFSTPQAEAFRNMSPNRERPLAELVARDITTAIATASTTIVAPVIIKSSTLQIVQGSTTVTPTIVVETRSETPMSTTTMKDPRVICGRMGRDLADACMATHEAKRKCRQNDFHCLCNKHKAQETCFHHCPFDERVPDIVMQKNKVCNMALAIPSPRPLHPKYTSTRYGPKTFVATYISYGPIVTEIGYNNGKAGPVTVWTGPAGHTHTPSIVRSQVDGKMVLQTLNARPTNAAAHVKPAGLAPVMAGGVIAIMAAVI